MAATYIEGQSEIALNSIEDVPLIGDALLELRDGEGGVSLGVSKLILELLHLVLEEVEVLRVPIEGAL